MKQGLLLVPICALPASPFAQAPAQGSQQPQSAKAARTGGSHRTLGIDGHGRLSLAHGNAAQGGDSASVPVNAEGRRMVNAWDPAKDEARLPM